MMLAFGAVAVLPISMRYLRLLGGVEWLIAIGKWPLLVMAIAFGMGSSTASVRVGKSRSGGG